MPSRSQHPRALLPRLLVYCEGSRTEPRYLYDWYQTHRARVPYEVTVKPGKGHNALVTVEDAITEGRRKRLGTPLYDITVCVLDAEHAAHAETLAAAIALARKHKITLYLSNPSFEVWLLCHFGRVTGWLENGDAAARRLTERHWRKEFGCDYDKGDPELYTRLAPRLPNAVDNARWLLEDHHDNAECRDANPSTNVYQLVERLLTLPPDPVPTP